jgi:hypothetical protein
VISAGVAATVLLMAGSPADAGRVMQQRAATDAANLSIRIMDVPVGRVDDPRALAYIVDYLNPGAAIRRRVEIKNTSSQRQHVDLYAGAAQIENNTFTVADGRSGNDLSGWVSLDPAGVDLPGKSSRQVWVTIAVPVDASKGERYGAIWAQIARPPTAGNTIGEINRVGIRMYLDVGPGGEPPTDFAIKNLTVARSTGKWPAVTAEVDNTGQRALDMTGSLSLADADATVKAGPFTVATGVTILPGQTGHVTALIDKPLPAGTWAAALTLTSGTVTRTASATITLSAAGQPAVVRTARSDWKTLGLASSAGVVLAMALLLLTLYLVRRRRTPARA